MDTKTHLKYVAVIFSEAVIIAALFGYVATHKNAVEFKTQVCDNLTLFGFPNKSNDLEGYFQKYNVGPRVWHQINKNMWIEMYGEQNMFHLYSKQHVMNLNNCDGVVLKRNDIRKMPNEVELFVWSAPQADSLLLFMPNDYKCSPLMSGNDGSTAWKEVYPLTKY